MSRILYSSSIIPWSWEKQTKPLHSSTSSSVLPSHSSFLEVSLLTPKRQKQNQKPLNFNTKSFQTLKFLSLRNRPNSVQKKSQDEVDRKTESAGQCQEQKERDHSCPQGAPRPADQQTHEQVRAVKCGGAHLLDEVLWNHKGGSH